MELLGQFIDGGPRRGRGNRVLVDLNPYNGATLAEFAVASAADVDEAHLAAQRAQRAWAATLPTERCGLFQRMVALLDQRRDEIVGWLIRESGSTRTKATIEWAAVRNGMSEAAMLPYRAVGRTMPIDVAGKESRTYREPVGVVGVISPWNVPMHLSNRSVAPALALGNAVVLKPSEETPVTGGLLLADLYAEAGLPAGLLNVVVGLPDEIGDIFVTHPASRFISFTGSTQVGQRVGALAIGGHTLKHVALELGGNAPFIVLADADVEQAAHAAVVSRFMHQGQVCMSANRLIILSDVYADFRDAFLARTATLKIGDPDSPATTIGPLINLRQMDRALGFLADARAANLPELQGGAPDGLVLPPHVFGPVSNNGALAQAELFSPIAPLIVAEDEAHAQALANATEFGLSSAVFTRDEARGIRFARGVHAGMTHVNDISIGDEIHNPFGGAKNSGLGRFNGDWIVGELTTEHWVTVQEGRRPYPF